MTGVELIEQERARQVEEEGWDTAHDDEHAHGELASAAACYAIPPHQRAIHPVAGVTLEPVPLLWPHDWSFRYWKHTTSRIRELAKAGALIAAEIDRLQRTATKGEEDNPQW